MIKSALSIISSIFWLVLRFFKRKDANEPQRILDQARDASARKDDATLNAALDAAADRLRNKTTDHP